MRESQSRLSQLSRRILAQLCHRSAYLLTSKTHNEPKNLLFRSKFEEVSESILAALTTYFSVVVLFRIFQCVSQPQKLVTDVKTFYFAENLRTSWNQLSQLSLYEFYFCYPSSYILRSLSTSNIHGCVTFYSVVNLRSSVNSTLTVHFMHISDNTGKASRNI